MGSILYLLVVGLIAVWAIGFFGFHVGGIIHLVLVGAAVVLVIRLMQGRKV